MWQPRYAEGMLQLLDGGVRIRLKKHKSIDPSCSVSMVKDAAGGVTV